MPLHKQRFERSSFMAASLTVGLAAATLLASACVASGDGEPDDTDDTVAEAEQAVGGGDGEIVPAPRGLVVKLNSDREINIGWTCGSNQAAWHRVMRTIGRDGTPTQVWEIPTCPVNQQRIAFDHEIQPGVEYCYVVHAGNDYYSESSEQLCVTSLLDLAAPALPKLYIHEIWRDKLVWIVDDVADNESYIIFEWRKSGTTAWNSTTFQRTERAHRASGFVGYVTADNLEPSTYYNYRARIGHQFAPMEVVTQEKSMPTNPAPPSMPGAFRVTGTTSNSVTLAWTDQAHEDKYIVRARQDETNVSVGTKTLDADTTTTTFTGLTSSTRYRFFIEAKNTSGTSESAETVVYTQVGQTIPHSNNVTLFDVALPPGGTGRPVNQGTFGPFFGPGNNNPQLKAFRVLPTSPLQVGLTFIRPGAPNSDCDVPANRRVIANDQSLGPADFQFLYGTTSLSTVIPLRVCGNFSPTIPSSWTPIVIVEWTSEP